MTPQEIIKEIRKLPPTQQKEVRDSFENGERKTPVTEEEFFQVMLAEGVISEIPPREFDGEEEDFEPIVVDGEPLSEMIIRDRR